MTESESPLRWADQLFDAGRYEEASAAYQRGLDEGADEAAAHYGLAISAAARGLYPEAKAHYRAVLLLDPGHANAAYQLGLVAETEGQPEQALRWYRQATIWNPGHAQAQKAITRLDTPTDGQSTPPGAPHASTASAPGGTPLQAASPAPKEGGSRSQPVATGAPIDAAPAAARSTLAQELAAGDFSTQQVHHGDLLTSRRGRLLRSYVGWVIPPLLVLLAAYLPQQVIGRVDNTTAIPLVASMQSIAQSLSWPFLSCVVGLVLLSWLTTIYSVFERRIDVLSGIFRRRQRTLWLYEVSRAPRYQQSMIEMITGTGTIVVESDALPTRVRLATGQAGIGSLRLRSLAPIKELATLTESLRTRHLYERRAMLDRFIGR